MGRFTKILKAVIKSKRGTEDEWISWVIIGSLFVIVFVMWLLLKWLNSCEDQDDQSFDQVSMQCKRAPSSTASSLNISAYEHRIKQGAKPTQPRGPVSHGRCPVPCGICPVPHSSCPVPHGRRPVIVALPPLA